jgi:hypothetical protein
MKQFCFVAIFIAILQIGAFGQATMRRSISPNQPMWLIHIDTWNWADPQKIIDLVPQDIRPYVVMNISLSISHDVATQRFKVAEYGYEIAKSWVRTCAQNRIWCMVQPSSGGFAQFSDFDLTVYREFFQNYPNFIGFNYAEQFWGYDDPNDALSAKWSDRITHFANLLQLCNQYGGYLVVSWCGNQWSPNINPIGMLKRNSTFAAACRNYTENYILLEKYTQQSYQSDMESVCLGAYLSGYSGQYGCRYDDTGWTDASGNHANFTMATAGAVHLEHVMLTGQTVLDGPELIWTQCFRETNRVATTDGYTMRNWETFPQFNNVSVDIFRKIIDGTVRIPTRQEVITRTKFVIINDVNSGTSNDIYSSPETMFEGLYRMDGDGNYQNNKTFFKKTGRYPTVPTVYLLDDAVANSFQFKVNRSAYSSRWPSVSGKTNEFNTQFPQEYTGTIYAGRHENGWVVYNPYKTATTATGNIPFKYNTCTSMDLSFSQYTAGVVKEFSNKLNIYLSNYDNVLNTGLKTDIIKIYGSSSQPTFSYTDRGSHQASSVSGSWSGGVFTLTINHNGPIDITINCAGTATGRLTSYTNATLVPPSQPSVYTGPLQYEAECWDYKSITGITTGGYDGSIRNYTGQGYLEFGTNSSASVRDYVNVPGSGSYTLAIKYSTTGGNVTTIDLYVNGTKVATPAFTATSTYSAWAVNSQTVSLNTGANTIELRANATGARTIYFDNIVLSSASACTPTAIIPYIQVDGGSWQQTSNITINSGSTVKLGPQPVSGGSWTWSGCGTSGTSREQTISPTGSCIATATYTNSCGAQSTQNFNITVNGSSTSTITIQENTTGFCSVDGSVASSNSGYTGTGYADTNSATGAGVSWSVNIPSAGVYILKWRYASASDRPANLKVDGTVVASNVAFPSTVSWTTWVETGTTSVSLAAGTRVIRLEATNSAGMGNIDYMIITGVSPSGVACSGVKSAVAGNATKEYFTDQPSIVSTKYYTVTGKRVYKLEEQTGIIIVRNQMSDGTITTSKIFISKK